MSLLFNRFNACLLCLVGCTFFGLPRLSLGQTPFVTQWGFNPSIGPSSVSCSQDGTLVGISTGSSVCIYSVATQLPYAGVMVTSGTVTSFKFSPDGKTIAIVTSAGYSTNVVELWNYQSSQYLGAISATTSIYAIAFSPNGQTLAIGGLGALLEEWNVSTRRRTAQLETKANVVYSVAYSSDGKLLAEGGVVRNVASLELWTARSGAISKELSVGDLTQSFSVAFSSKGTSVVCAGTTASQGAVVTWNVATGAVQSEQRGDLPIQYGSSLSANGTQLVLYGATTTPFMGQTRSNGWLSLWDVSSLQSPVNGWSEGWSAVGAAFSGDGSVLVDIATADSWFGTAQGGGFEPTGGYFDILEGPGKLAGTAMCIAAHNVWPAPTVAYVQPTFSPDGEYVVGGGADYGGFGFTPQSSLVSVWESKSGKTVAALPTGANITLLTAAFTKDDKYLAIGGPGSGLTGVQLWDLKTSKLVRTLGSNITPLQFAFSPTRTLLAVAGNPASGDDVIQLWDYSTGKLIETLVSAANNGISGLAFSANGTSLAVGGSTSSGATDAVTEGTLEIWNVDVKARTKLLPTKESVVNGVTFSPNGKTLAASGQFQASYGATTEGEIELWNLSTWKLQSNLPLFSGTNSVSSSTFSETGTVLYAIPSGGPGAVQLVNLLTDKLLGYLNAPSTKYLALSADCKTAVSSDFTVGLTVGAVPPLVSAPLKSITFSPSSISENEWSTATVTLSKPAPPGGVTVGIEVSASSFFEIGVPPTLTIPAGATSGTFSVQAYYISSTTLNFTVLSGTYSVSGVLQVN